MRRSPIAARELFSASVREVGARGASGYAHNEYAQSRAQDGSYTTETHRTLTVREVARLQGFPDSFRFVGSQMDQRRHVGNAVPPPLSRRIADAIVSAGM